MNRKVVIRLCLIAIGIILIFLAIFAYQLGLDNDPGWGTFRIQLFIIGLGIILFGSLYWITPKLVGQAFNAINIEGKDIVELQTRTTNNKINNILLILSASFVICIYIWVITIGRIEKWPSGRDYYWKLTQAFQQGQTHLLEEPNPELAKLENPYDHHQRKGLEYLWDTTYYDGKYFLYWGPVPAVIGVFISAITSKPVTDAGLVFSFVIGTALFSVLLLHQLTKQFNIPTWAFWGGIFASMINVPLIWLLTRPTFYEVSISGGQFFLMMGFYFLFLGFKYSQPHKGWILASALSFGLAGATRINLLPSVIVLTALILLRIYFANDKKFSKSIPTFTSLMLPLILIAISLCWYNYARFGSIFEFGHRYQLTGPALTADYGDINSVQYILPNTFTYIFRQPELSLEFPFLTVPRIKKDMWPFFIRLPEHYTYNEPMAGIVFVVPLIGLMALLLTRSLWLFINGDIPHNTEAKNQNASLFSWFTFSIFVYVVIQIFILLTFLYSAMRYLFDFSPALIVLSTMLVGYYVQVIDNKSYLVKIVTFLWILSSILTVCAGFLIGFTGDKNNFLNQNPAIYYQLYEWFSR